MASSIAGSSIGATSLRTRSEMYMSMVGEGQILRTQTTREKLREARDFLFDPSTGKIFGRSLLDFVLWIILHVAIFVVCCLTIGFLLWIHYYIINWNYPIVQGADSLIQTPGLEFRPHVDVHSTIIRFLKGDSTSYFKYIDDIEAYLRYYENQNQQGENYIDCSEIRERRTRELDRVCRFNIEWLGPNCVKQQDYGFVDGQPCILLKLNKVINWMPEEYTNETVPDEIREHWDQWAISVRCEGETPTDRENIGPIVYFPDNGFHFRHFPFRNQQGYRSPLVFVRFDGPRPGNLIMVNCKAYARNIIHNRNEMIGMTHFELIVD